MQERGELFLDEVGRWVARESLDWGALPARVEAAIAERIDRVPEACRRILSAIGRSPALDFLDPGLRAILVELERLKRIFRVGDAGNGRFRQAAIAVGDGLRTAMEIQAGESPCA